jgi:exopolysaccharide biosynthesis polyprenyl glycosylphosphotransferase
MNCLEVILPVTNFRRRFLMKTFVLSDLGILASSYVLAAVGIWHLTEFSSFAAFFSMRIKLLNILLLLGLFYSWHLIISAFGLYGSRRLGGRKQEVVDVLKATSVAVIVLAMVAHIVRVRMITPAFLLEFWAIASANLILCRLLMRQFLALLRTHGRNVRHVLIVGTNPRAEEFARTIGGRSELGYKLIGFADQEWTGNRHFRENGKLIVTDLDHFSDFLREHIVDEVVIALPMKSLYSQAARIVGECKEQGIIVRGLTSLFDFQQGSADANELDLTHVSTYSTNLCEGTPLVFKRLLDVIGALTLLICLASALLIVAIMVKFDSPGPAFFVQERVGRNKRKFRMYKFRTMVAHAEKEQLNLEKFNEADGPVFKIKEDPRITRLGKYLRKASIDELPQLLNVLKGDMSLVGPRPLPLRDYQGFDQAWLSRRFSVRPGITCLWQVNGRSATTFGRWMELDMQYVDNWSLSLDLKILAKTVPAVFVGRGAV